MRGEVTHVIRVQVDLDRCEGYANCVMALSEVFDVDDDGKVVLLRAGVSEQMRARSTEAVRSCPGAAIWLAED